MIHALGGCQTRASEERSLYAGEVVGSIPKARTIENRNNEHFSAPLQKHHTAIEAFRTLPTRKIVHMVQKGEQEARQAKKEMVSLESACAEPAENWNSLKERNVILDRHDGRHQGTSL